MSKLIVKFISLRIAAAATLFFRIPTFPFRSYISALRAHPSAFRADNDAHKIPQRINLTTISLTKRKQLGIQSGKMYWLFGRKS